MRISYLAKRIERENQTKWGWNVTNTNNINHIAEIIKKWPWSPIIWDRGVRDTLNYVEASWCSLDFDDGETSLEEAVRLFCDSVHIIGTTKSHQKEKKGVVCDRFRVVLKFEETVTDVLRFLASMGKAVDNYGTDPQCKDGGRFYWPCTEIVSICSEGYSHDVSERPTVIEESEIDLSLYEGKFMREETFRILKYGLRPGDGRNVRCFRAALDLFRIGWTKEKIFDLLFKHVSEEQNFGDKEKKEILNSASKRFKISPRKVIYD